MEEEFVSKSQRKRESHAVQELGERLIALSTDQLAELDIDEKLRDAVMEAKRLQKEARRRQLQYIGRLMRDIDVTPIRARLAAWDGTSAAHTAHMHLLERWRERLIENEAAVTELAAAYPDVDLQRLRTLIRNARHEKAANKPPKSYRLIYQELRGVIPERTGGATGEE